MDGRPSDYDVDRLLRHVRSHGCAAAFYYAPAVDSTNQWAKRMFAEAPHGTVLLADAQTAGRGRFGRTWYSPPGVSIYMSWVVKETDLPTAGVFWHFAAAWAVTGVLEKELPDVEAKWPNDLWVRDRKLAGFLTELLYAGTRPQGIVVGIGLNVHTAEWPPSMDVRPISLEEATGRRWDRTDVVIAVVDALAQADRLGGRAMRRPCSTNGFRRPDGNPVRRFTCVYRDGSVGVGSSSSRPTEASGCDCPGRKPSYAFPSRRPWVGGGTS